MTSNEANGPKLRRWAGRLLAVLVTVAFLGSATAKLAHVPKVSEELTHAGIPQGAIVPIAILELSCLVFYLFPRTSILGTFLLTGYLGGAIVTHIIGRQNFLPPLLVGLMMFASAYLRVAELREIVPFRKSLTVSDGASRSAISVAS
jgi:hypothetical protein